MLGRSYFSDKQGSAASRCLTLLIILLQTVSALAVPVAQEQSATDLTQPDDFVPVMSNSTRWSNSQLRVKMVWSNDPLDEKAVYMTSLHCTGIFVTADPGKVFETPDVCYRPGYGKVAVNIDGVQSSTRPSYMPADQIAATLITGVGYMVQKNIYHKLQVKLFDGDIFMGSITFAPRRESPPFIKHDLDGSNAFTTMEGAPVGSAPELLSEDSMTDVVADQQQDPPTRSPADDARDASVGIEVVYTYSIEEMGEIGLTLRAYTLAAFNYFDFLLDEVPQSRKEIVEGIEISPFQIPGVLGLDITIFAGYNSVTERTEPPFFTAFSLAAAIVEIPLQLLGDGMNMHFFKCQVVADGYPIGNLWVKRGIVLDTKLDGGSQRPRNGVVSSY